MDKLENYKNENITNDAIVDDVAAKAYMENFSLETFNRGDEAQRTNKVTRQTADTFQAAATFMDLLTIWGPLEPDIQAKAKFAKFHALRIAKAIKAGEDPNSTNPIVEQPPEVENVQLNDGIEAELKDMENDAGVYKPPTVEGVPDNQVPPQPDTAFPSEVPRHGLSNAASIQPQPDVSPIETSDKPQSRTGSVGGGYFPSVSETPSHVNAVAPLDQPPSATSTFATSSPTDFYSSAPVSQPGIPSSGQFGIPSPDRPGRPTPHQMTAQPPTAPPVHRASPTMATAPTAALSSPTSQARSQLPTSGYRTDDESVLGAQKHAKWAISALNFEDVNTAVKELRIALDHLGAG